MSQDSSATKQEGFFISDDTQGRRKKIVRQDRIHIETGKCWLDFNGIKLEVLNVSAFGCACIATPESIQKLQVMFHDQEHWTAKVFYEGTETQALTLHRVREENHPTSVTGEMVWGFETSGEPLKVDRIRVLEKTSEVFQKQNAYSEKIGRLPLLYRQLVFQMKDWFQRLKESIDELERNAPVDNAQEASEYCMTIVENVGEYIGRLVPQVYKEVPAMLKGLNQEDMQLAGDFIREQVGPYIFGSPFAARAYYKPRGYAGDYEMMNHLYRAEITGRTLYDQCVHKYFVEEPAGQAVKNRGTYLVAQMKKLMQATPTHQPLKIISVASGPAVEQQLFLQEGKEFFGRPVEFTCLDQDEESLKHAQRQIGSIDRFVKSGFKFNFKNLAIRNVIVAGLPGDNYDMIYSAGLFDYLTEPVAQMAAQKMMAGLKPGGQLVIGNFSTENPCTPFMELWLDWNLIYRTPEDLQRMFKGFGSKVWVEKEPLGVNLFVVIEK